MIDFDKLSFQNIGWFNLLINFKRILKESLSNDYLKFKVNVTLREKKILVTKYSLKKRLH